MSKKNPTALRGHIACALAYLIFGFNIVVSKNMANSDILSPMDLFCLRAIVSASLFWFLSLFISKEKVEKKDLLNIFAASILGLYITQITFLKAITMTTPMDASILASLSPIMTMFFAALFLKEPITFLKVLGVLLSFAGALLLITNSLGVGNVVENTSIQGALLMLCNSMAFALYLGIFRPLIIKYSVVTYMKWMFLFTVIVSVPFNITALVNIEYSVMSTRYLWELAFLTIISTFVAYLLIPIGQKYLRPTLVSMYSYIQPIVAVLLSVLSGLDVLGWQKIVASLLVFGGVAIVSKSRSANINVMKQ
ncbi:MAG TPA: DMT family transporter [Bacteroidaceae bacterium]|nr:DMT family transporter [Bacteroidaceae bacterium]